MGAAGVEYGNSTYGLLINARLVGIRKQATAGRTRNELRYYEHWNYGKSAQWIGQLQ